MVTVEQVIDEIKKHLTPDLLKDQYRTDNVNNPLFGHCYHATEALYHIIRDFQLPAEFMEFKPCRGIDESNIAHWWLQNEQGDILDPTAEQYKSRGIQPPYHNGRFRPFLTKEPSKKAKTIMKQIMSTECLALCQ